MVLSSFIKSIFSFIIVIPLVSSFHSFFIDLHPFLSLSHPFISICLFSSPFFLSLVFIPFVFSSFLTLSPYLSALSSALSLLSLLSFLSLFLSLPFILFFFHDFFSSHLISSHLISSLLISSHLISSHLISSHLHSSHLSSSPLISTHSSILREARDSSRQHRCHCILDMGPHERNGTCGCMYVGTS